MSAMLEHDLSGPATGGLGTGHGGAPDLEYFVTGNAALRRNGGLSLTHPTFAELALSFAVSDSIRVHVDSADGGGISCACGIADFCTAVAPEARLEVVLQNAYPLDGLPLAAYPQARMAWLRTRHPCLDVRTVCAPGAPALSEFGASEAVPAPEAEIPAAPSSSPSSTGARARGLMVYGTGSSVGKGTVALLLGLGLRRARLRPVPFKALSGLACRFPVPTERQQCPSTLLHWNVWGYGAEPLPHFLDPLLLLPPESHRAADGTLSAFDPRRRDARSGHSYRLGEFYGAGFERLSSTLAAAAEASAAFSASRDGVLVAEGSGSPLDLVGEWDLANESVRDRFGVPYLLVAPADARGYFGLAGSLAELGERGMRDGLLGVVACETAAAPASVTGTVVDAVRELLRDAGVPFLGLVGHERLLAESLCEDTPPSGHAPVSPDDLARLTRAFERSVDTERIAAAALESP